MGCSFLARQAFEGHSFRMRYQEISFQIVLGSPVPRLKKDCNWTRPSVAEVWFSPLLSEPEPELDLMEYGILADAYSILWVFGVLLRCLRSSSHRYMFVSCLYNPQSIPPLHLCLCVLIASLALSTEPCVQFRFEPSEHCNFFKSYFSIFFCVQTLWNTCAISKKNQLFMQSCSTNHVW